MVEPSTDASGPTRRLVQQSVQGASETGLSAFCGQVGPSQVCSCAKPNRRTTRKSGKRPASNRPGRDERSMVGLSCRLTEVFLAWGSVTPGNTFPVRTVYSLSGIDSMHFDTLKCISFRPDCIQGAAMPLSKGIVSMAHASESDRDLFYALARSADEAERLNQQAELWRKATSRVLDQLDLAPGMSCLDFGCGAGDVMLALGRRVGPSGNVVGVDTDADLGRNVAKELTKTGASRFSFLEADITKPESLPTELFDVTSARFLLVHLEDPVVALRTMWNLTRPGGVLVVFDYDFRTHDTHPACPELEEFIAVVDGVFEKAGLDPRIGSKLPHYLERAAEGPPDGVETSGFITPLPDLREFLLLSYKSLLPAALDLGVTTEGKAEKMIAFLEGGAAESPSYWLSALYCSAWKRKP
jgi:ubiquinone/menaquinone biosynthesis C-methylase UbiE